MLAPSSFQVFVEMCNGELPRVGSGVGIVERARLVEKAVHLLGWTPCLSLSQSVRFTLDEYRITGLMEQEIFDQRAQHIDEYMKLRAGS